jgi:hypothetical protein
MGSIEGARGQIVDRLLRVAALAGAVAYVPSIYGSIAWRLWLVAAVDSLAFAVFIATALNRRASYRAKLSVLIGAGIAIAGAVLYYMGPYGAGYVYLLGVVFLVVLLGDARFIALTIVASAAILGAYALLVALDVVRIGQPLITVFITDSNIILIGAMLAIAGRSLVSGLEIAYGEEQRLVARVGEELEAARAADAALLAEMAVKERLVKELHHRVHNNMQVVLSLLEIEDARRDGLSIGRMARRVRALSFADDLTLSDPDAETVDLHHFVTMSLVALRVSGDAGDSFSARPFTMPIPVNRLAGLSIAVAEILAALTELRLPVEVATEGDERLTFTWSPAPGGEDAALAARLCNDPVAAGLAGPGGLCFERNSEGGEATLYLDLPR